MRVEKPLKNISFFVVFVYDKRLDRWLADFGAYERSTAYQEYLFFLSLTGSKRYVRFEKLPNDSKEELEARKNKLNKLVMA